MAVPLVDVAPPELKVMETLTQKKWKKGLMIVMSGLDAWVPPLLEDPVTAAQCFGEASQRGRAHWCTHLGKRSRMVSGFKFVGDLALDRHCPKLSRLLYWYLSDIVTDLSTWLATSSSTVILSK